MKGDGMSYCSLVYFRDGKPFAESEYRNAWGGAAKIWSDLFDAYLKRPSVPYDNWLMRCAGDDSSLWDLAKRKDLPLFERAVHASTFDHAIIRREHFQQFVRHLREFVSKYPADGKVNHLPSWADAIETSDAEAVGFYGTSVGDNPWFRYDSDSNETIPYDLNTGDEHFEVYDWLESMEPTEAP
jgi:hypothetical protein